MAITRRPDWERQLTRWVNRAQNEPFVWGHWDCCLAMAAGVEAMTGVDLGARTRGRYGGQPDPEANARSAARFAMRLAGIADYEAAVVAEIERYGLIELPAPTFARRGDVAMADGPEGPTWGIVDLTGRRVVMAAYRLDAQWVELTSCRRAWKVG